MTVGEWNKIKNDPTLWSEMHMRRKMLRAQNKKRPTTPCTVIGNPRFQRVFPSQ
jgi:hypothetical protein